MQHQPRFIKKRLNQIIAATFLSSLGLAAHAGDFSLQNNQVTFTGGGPITVDSDGVASASTLPGGALPNVSFSLVNSSESNGTFLVRLRMRIDSQTDNDSVTMRLGVVRVVVADGAVTSTAMVLQGETGYETISVSATKQSGSSTTTLATETLRARASMLDSNGDEVTIRVDQVVSHLLGNNALFDDILGGFMLNDHYDYRIGVESISGPTTLSVGHLDGETFTAFPRLLNACSGFTVLGTLTVGNPSADLVEATAVAESCAPAEDEDEDEDDDDETDPNEPDPILNEEDLDEANTELDSILSNLPPEGNVGEEVVSNVNQSLTNSGNIADLLLNNLLPPADESAPPPVLNTGNTLAGLTNISKAASTGSTVSGRTGDSNTSASLVNQSVNLINTTATVMTALADAPRSQALTSAQQTQVQDITSNLVSSIDSIVSTTTDVNTLQQLAQSTATALQAQAKLNVPATAAQVDAMVNVSVKIATTLIQQALGEGAPSDEEIRAILTSNPALLERVVENTLPVPPTTTVPIGERLNNVTNAVAQRNLSLPEAASARAAQATQSFVNPANVQIGGVSVLSILNGFLTGGSQLLTIVDEFGRVSNTVALTDGNASITVDAATGAVVVKVPGETYTGMIVAVRAVPTTIPNGITFRRDGRAMIVSNGTAVELATNAADVIGFIATLENLGYAYTQRNNASFSLNIGGGQRFVGAFAYDNLVGKDVDSCGAVTIGTPSGELNSPNYKFTAICANGGITQAITPFIDNADFFASVAGFGFDARADRNTGIITVTGVGTFKPSFFIAPRTDAEKAFHAANKDSFNMAYQSGDFNGDGKLDFKVISSSGAQVLYGVN